MIEPGYARAATVADAIRLAGSTSNAKYLGGGTNLVDLMRETIEHPEMLIDVSRLSGKIEAREDGALLIGAGVTNTAIAASRLVRERFPLLARAILAGASGQIRNMATAGGNILQRTRCLYFYDDASRCNKRAPGTGCDAVEGLNRMHAILGASSSCVAVHPSDMCVALAALDAVVHLDGPAGGRQVKLVDFHRLPGDTPEIETELRADELITGIEVPPSDLARRSTYRKVRDRASYAFAIVSVAAALDLEKDGRVREVRLALGGVAHKPWRATKAEAALRGKAISEESLTDAADMELADARALGDNGFKIELVRRLIVHTLLDLGAGDAA